MVTNFDFCLREINKLHCTLFTHMIYRIVRIFGGGKKLVNFPTETFGK